MASLLGSKQDDWTWEDLQDLPDGQRYEIVDGALVVNALPNARHDVVATELQTLLRAAAPADLYVLGPSGVGMGRTFRGPDILVVRRSVLRERTKYFEARDIVLAVEVLSPSTRTTDKVTKRHEYVTAGIPTYWLVDPDVPSLLVLSGPDEGLSAIGDGAVSLTAPFPVHVRPGDLLP